MSINPLPESTQSHPSQSFTNNSPTPLHTRILNTVIPIMTMMTVGLSRLVEATFNESVLSARISNRGVLPNSKDKLAETLIPSFQIAKKLIEQKYPKKIASAGPDILKRIENLGFLKATLSSIDLAPFIEEAATDGSNLLTNVKENLEELHLKFVNAYHELINTELVTAQAFEEHVIDGGKENKKMQDAYSALQHFVQALLLQDRKMENILTQAAYFAPKGI